MRIKLMKLKMPKFKPVKWKGNPLPKPQIKEAHKLGKRLAKHKDRVKTPYALATWMTKRKYK